MTTMWTCCADLCACVSAGFLKSSPSPYLPFLKPFLRSQGFMSFIEDAGVTGELMRIRNALKAGSHYGPPPTAATAQPGMSKSLFGPASIMSLHTGTYTGGVAGIVGKGGDGSATGAGSGSRYSAFGWGGGSGPLNEGTAAIVRDIIMGVDSSGKYHTAGNAVDSSLEADAVYIRLFDWTVMRHVTAGTKDEAIASKPTGGLSLMRKFIGTSKLRAKFASKLSGNSTPPLDAALPPAAGAIPHSGSYGATVDSKYNHEALSSVCRDLVVLLCSELHEKEAESAVSCCCAELCGIAFADVTGMVVCVFLLQPVISVLDLAAEVTLTTSHRDTSSPNHLASHGDEIGQAIAHWHPRAVKQHIVPVGDKHMPFPSLNHTLLGSYMEQYATVNAVHHHLALAEEAVLKAGSDSDTVSISREPSWHSVGKGGTIHLPVLSALSESAISIGSRTGSFNGLAELARPDSTELDGEAPLAPAAAAAAGGFSRRRRAAGTRMSMLVAGIDQASGASGGMATPHVPGLGMFSTPAASSGGRPTVSSTGLTSTKLRSIPRTGSHRALGSLSLSMPASPTMDMIDSMPLDDEREWVAVAVAAVTMRG